MMEAIILLWLAAHAFGVPCALAAALSSRRRASDRERRGYADREEWLSDARNPEVPLDEILDRCAAHGVPPKAEAPVSHVTADVALQVASSPDNIMRSPESFFVFRMSPPDGFLGCHPAPFTPEKLAELHGDGIYRVEHLAPGRQAIVYEHVIAGHGRGASGVRIDA